MALEELSRQRQSLADAGASLLTVAVDRAEDETKVRAAAQRLGLPVMIAGEDVAGTYSILHRYLFDRREDLPLPTLLLLSAKGEIVKVYREPIAAAGLVEDIRGIEVSADERLARAVPFPGTFHSSPGERNYFQYGLELSEQGFDAPALIAFERVAKLDPSAITFYNLGTLYMKGGQPSRAKAAFERALELQPDNADAGNSLGALLAQSGEVPAAIERFRAALKLKPDFPDALNNLGFALFQTGQADRGLRSLPEGPEAPTRLPGGAQQPGHLLRPPGRPRSRAGLLPRGGGQARELRRGRQQPCPGARGPRETLRRRSPCFDGCCRRTRDSRWRT